jgi:curved DNA-binding protein CbpA
MAKISNLDFYAILGVHPNAEDIVIRAAFKALAQRYHPDRFAGSKDEAHRRMADLTNAYETLADPARRRKYDRRRGLSARQAKFYFKNPARDRQPFGALAARAAARKARHYRIAVYVLMVAVVILSGFNVHQHSAQIKELFAWNRTASGPIVDGPRRRDAPRPRPADAASSSAPRPHHGQRQDLPIGRRTRDRSNAARTAGTAPHASDPVVAAPPPDAAATVARNPRRPHRRRTRRGCAPARRQRSCTAADAAQGCEARDLKARRRKKWRSRDASPGRIDRPRALRRRHRAMCA